MRRLLIFSFVILIIFCFSFAVYADDYIPDISSTVRPLPKFAIPSGYRALLLFFENRTYESGQYEIWLINNTYQNTYKAKYGSGDESYCIFYEQQRTQVDKCYILENNTWKVKSDTPVYYHYMYPYYNGLYYGCYVISCSEGMHINLRFTVDSSAWTDYFPLDDDSSGLVSSLINGLLNGLKSLFIPSVNILTLIVEKFTNKFPIINQVGDLFTSLFNPGTDEPIFNITYNGMTLKIIDFTMFSDYMLLIRNFTGVFLLLSFLTREVKKLPR